MRGMNRTTILSHGGRHDAAGVTGTHLKGTVPPPTVMEAIPPSLGTVGNLPETARPGTAQPPQRPGQQVNVQKRYFDDEGRPDFPRRGPSTQRPSVEEEKKPEEPAATAPEAPAEPATATPPPPPAPAPPVSDEVSGTNPPTPVTPPAEKPSRRKLTRATNEQLRTWCAEAGINPAEYADTDAEVTGDLMRRLLAEHHGITL